LSWSTDLSRGGSLPERPEASLFFRSIPPDEAAMTMRSETKTSARGIGVLEEEVDSSPTPNGNRRNAPAADGSWSKQVTTPEERRALIARSAYLKAERRGFQSSPEPDWLEAEAEFNALPVGSGSPDQRPEQVDR
jgi:Protein of unknown function (DUF2934)